MLANYIEFSILLEKPILSEQLLADHKTELINDLSDYLIWYFEALRIYFENDRKKLIDHIKSKVDAQPTAKDERVIGGGWEYNDAREILRYKENNDIKDIIFKVFDFLEGKISGQELINFINEINK